MLHEVRDQVNSLHDRYCIEVIFADCVELISVEQINGCNANF